MLDHHPIEFIDKEKNDSPTPTPMQELNEALKACKFGKFHIRLLLTSFIRNIAGLLVSSTTPYILSNAECDLNMNLVDKGFLTSISFMGMVVSSVIIGFLTDTFGRRKFIISGLAGLFVVMLIGGCSQNFEMLVTAKFFEGILHGTVHGAAMTLTSEFCHKDIRDRVMIAQASFISLCQVTIAAMSWGILIQDWKFSLFGGYLVLNTWNLYLIAMSLWALFACLLFVFIPESPKFLLTQRRYTETREILINVYKENTGKSADTYEFINLWKNKEKSADLIENSSNTSTKSNLCQHIVVGLHNVKPMFRKPLGIYLMVLCSMNFFVMAIYNVIRLWFPQLSTIVEHYATTTNSEDLCVMLDAYTQDLRDRAANETYYSGACVPIKSGTETYVNSIIIGCVSFIPTCLNGILVNRVGKKGLFISAGVVSTAVTLSLRWANSKLAVVSLFSSDAAITQTMMSLTIVTAVELFPTTIRTFSVSIVLMAGRFGTLIGSVCFPILLNISCVVPFFTMTGIMISVVTMSFLLPSKK